MKIRLGTLTGTPSGKEGAGVYWALDGGRNAVGLDAIYYAIKDDKAIKIWPDEGTHRVTALRLAVSDEMSDLLDRYARSTADFRSNGAMLRLTIGTRVFTRSEVKMEIEWDGVSKSILFLNNCGPLAETVLRGDYVKLEASMNEWTQTFEPMESQPYTEELTRVATITPVTDCEVYAGAQWHGDFCCAAGLQQEDGTWVLKVQGQVSSGRSKKKGGSSRYGQQKTLKGLSGYFSVWLLGYRNDARVTVSYPAAQASLNPRVLEVLVK